MAKRSRSSRLGVSSLTRAVLSRRVDTSQAPRIQVEVLLGRAQVLGRVDRQPDALMAERTEATLGGERGEGRALVVASLGQACERLLAQHVDAAARPERQPGRLPEARDDVLPVQIDDAELRPERNDRDRGRRACLAVSGEQGGEVEVEQLVRVQGEDVAVLLPRPGGEAKAASASERLRLSNRHDLGTEPLELLGEERLLPGRAAHDRALDAGGGERLDRIRRERPPSDGDERLRLPARGVAEALGLPAREENGFHELVLLPVMLPSFWVASTKPESALGRSQGCQPWQGRGWALAPRDRGPEAGKYCWVG